MPRGSIVALPTLRSLPRCPPPLGLARRVLPSGTVVWSVPHPLSAASPPCRCVLGRGGRCPPLPSFTPHPWGGGGVSGGGGGACRLPFLHASRRHDASTAQARGAAPVPLQGGGGMPCGSRRRPFYPALPPPVVPPPGLARRVHSSGTVVWSVPHSLTAASLPCRVVLGGGGRFPPTPYPHPPPSGGRGWVGGAGAPMSSPLRCTHVAGTTQARHKHGVRHLAAAGGGFPLGLPALLHGIASAPQDHQPLLPLGGSRHVSAWCSVSRACSLLCPYLLEEVRTRAETDDEKVRAAGRTYRTPRRLLAPSAALVEGRAPVSAPNSPEGADCPSSPWYLCIHFRAA